jgi:hypothetical protein
LKEWGYLRPNETVDDRAARVERACVRHEIPSTFLPLNDMKIARRFVTISFALATSLLAADELALRLQPALEAISPDGLLAHIKVLASDEFEGRAPGMKGEELSVKYIADQFKQIGLKPGNPDGTYTLEVPLAGIKSEPRMSFMIGDKMIDLKYPSDFVASSARLQPEIKIDKSDMIFVGMASSRRNTAGTITKMSMCAARHC